MCRNAIIYQPGKEDGTKRGYLSKRTAEANRWHEKWFALYQNVLFYFESEQSARPAGIYMLEGCSCERAVVKLWLD
uniref:PH domain-containing protein n=1 Tax=Pavo cristatus TaxID=9049 RepID=A0A8C9G4V6_PAVCR